MIVNEIGFYFTHIHDDRGWQDYTVRYYPERRNKRGAVIRRAYLFFDPIDEKHSKDCFRILVHHFDELVHYVRLMEAEAQDG